MADPTNGANLKRNREILKFLAANDWSYQLVADKFGVSRNVVAGLVFRSRHPIEERVACFGRHPSHRTKTGTGWRPHSYEPAFTAKTHQV